LEVDEKLSLDGKFCTCSVLNVVNANLAGTYVRYSSSPKITAHSALIQNFFNGETGITGPAVHLTFDTDLSQDNASSSLAVKAYVSQPIGTNPKPENCVFVPIPCSVKYQLTEKAGRKWSIDY
jgi:hypothetical protein